MNGVAVDYGWVTVGVQISQKWISGLESGTDIGVSRSEITNPAKFHKWGCGRLRLGYSRCANQSEMAFWLGKWHRYRGFDVGDRESDKISEIGLR